MNVSVASGGSAHNAGTGNSEMNYRLTLQLSVEDACALWDAAAERCMSVGGLTIEDVEETLGPRQDPSIEDCLITLALPARIAGCTLTDFNLADAGDGLPVAPGAQRNIRAAPAHQGISSTMRLYAPVPHTARVA
ncbi:MULTISPECIES: hypothetical protein [Sphingomonas]|uniref:Uncharacterized protein n=1 Tax=Edaphosphingomonas fennica TaxID=114404 RepID=A0A2T4HPD7_9SPHN|nr:MULTISPECIES: hypothetical protein [Sphingomonas]AGH49110.1 hypothetical protein G432_06925 [Sphingomonas sp. MM-1]PTD17662.1 hypothetical protein CV103_16860 [Sphingomonas fennica]